MNSELLDRFYKGKCSPEEVQEVLQWFREKQPNPEQEQDLHVLWQEAAHTPMEVPDHDAGQLFRQIRAKINAPQQQAENVITFRQPATLPFWAKAAAVLLPLFLLGALLLYTAKSGTATTAYTTIEAAPGIRKTINLPDGSTIKLNAGSSVSFARYFDADKREITLQGEAFFEVAKDSLRPFIVHTGNISTQALGTSFNIDYNQHDSTINVALATGVVKVLREELSQTQQLSRLVPGQQLTYNKASQQYTVAPFEQQQVLAWTQGVLYFKDADMDQVIRKLEKWYGVKIAVDADAAATKPWNYTGEYYKQSLGSVLAGISYVKGFAYKQNGKHVKIMLH